MLQKSVPKIALETFAIIKTHLNVHWSPKFDVNKQLPYVGNEVLLMACKLRPFWVFRCVCERSTTLTSTLMSIRNFSDVAPSVI